MQGYGELSGAGHGRRAFNVTRHDHHLETPRAAPHDGPDHRDGWDASTSGRLRNDLARFRAVQAARIAAMDDPRRRMERRGAAFVAPRTGTADRSGWLGAAGALVPVQLVANLTFAFGAFVASVLFWNTFGPSFVMALIDQPGP
ncbi:MAG: hypothetical protein OXH76_09300 [Boseongicola sp.]|nr:hypothetical protein [Boseongicola sp.]MXY15583.1 hypothetical protein [Acidobacteriota bacterium]MYE10503.1 hypothetical protein [Gammaproteobacteria bacterium]